MALTREAVREQLDRAQQRRAAAGVNYIPKNKVVRLRILEFEDDEGNTIFSREIGEWREQGQNGRSILDRRCLNATDAVAALADKCNRTGEQFPYRKVVRYWVNAIDIDARKPEVQTWVLPTSVWQDVVNMAMSEEWADVLEPTNGHAFEIHREGSGLDTIYECNVTRKPWPVPEELLDQIKDPLESINDPGLESQLSFLGLSMDDLFEEEPGDVEPVSAESAGDKPKTPSKGGGGKTSKKSTSKAKEIKESELSEGARVSVNYAEDGDEPEWYNGTVTEIDGDDISIDFDDETSDVIDRADVCIGEDGIPFEDGDPGYGGPGSPGDGESVDELIQSAKKSRSRR